MFYHQQQNLLTKTSCATSTSSSTSWGIQFGMQKPCMSLGAISTLLLQGDLHIPHIRNTTMSSKYKLFPQKSLHTTENCLLFTFMGVLAMSGDSWNRDCKSMGAGSGKMVCTRIAQYIGLYNALPYMPKPPCTVLSIDRMHKTLDIFFTSLQSSHRSMQPRKQIVAMKFILFNTNLYIIRKQTNKPIKQISSPSIQALLLASPVTEVF